MNSNIKEDETLKLLKKYYLEALLAQQMDNKMPYDRDNVSWILITTLGKPFKKKQKS